MTYFEVLVEGGSDVPTMRELLTRKFGLIEKENFRIHPHKGRGKIPENVLAAPDPRRQTLLDQLPAKLKGFSYLGDDACVVVVVDADDTAPENLIADFGAMLEKLPRRPRNIIICLAVEETESWFIADIPAVLKAYPRAKLQRLKNIQPDAVVGAWEALADAIGVRRIDVTGPDKFAWAERVAPHLNFDAPVSPSLRQLVEELGARIEN